VQAFCGHRTHRVNRWPARWVASLLSYRPVFRGGIKKEHQVVRVSIYDTVECAYRVLELPKA
jgi:hypothetical protein